MFRNKRFLITQPLIRGINGSTVVTLELVKELLAQEAKVTVYTCDHAEPSKSFFKKAGIKVNAATENPNYKLTDFDYIWVHSQILPLSIINDLSHKLPSKLPAFIFLHMSGMDWIPDEKPWIFNLENQLSSLSLFISEEVKDVNKAFLDPSIPTKFYRNPAPDSFKNRTKKPSNTLRNILIVSSHPPKEILEAKKILSDTHHINVDILGEGQEKYQLFNKNILEKYDAIITIAKTVPYCLISGTPVYVYDTYGGGPGWLNQKNFDQAKYRNFSGYQNNTYPNYEGGVFHFKTASQIAQEIINGYQDSLAFHKQNISSFFDDFSLSSVLPIIFSNLHPRRLSTFSPKYTESVLSAQRLATIRFQEGGKLYERDEIINQLKQENSILNQRNHELENYKQNTEAVFQSKSYRMFDKAITPYKIIRGRKK